MQLLLFCLFNKNNNKLCCWIKYLKQKYSFTIYTLLFYVAERDGYEEEVANIHGHDVGFDRKDFRTYVNAVKT